MSFAHCVDFHQRASKFSDMSVLWLWELSNLLEQLMRAQTTRTLSLLLMAHAACDITTARVFTVNVIAFVN